MLSKVYIASSFSLIHKVREVEKALEDAGYTVLCKWWTGLDFIPGEGRSLKEKAQTVTPQEFYSSPGAKTAFERDFKAVKDADFLVFVADDEPRKYNGANVEYGIAVGDGKPCFSLGRLENSAMYYAFIKCYSIPDLLTMIKNALQGGS